MNGLSNAQILSDLLERHDISIIDFQQLNPETRFDSYYFSKKILHGMNVLCAKKHYTINEIATVTDGIHTSIDYDEKSNVNLLSATSPRENYFNLSRGAKISEKAHQLNPRTALRENDVIISTVGTIGNCAVVDDTILPANSDRHVGIIRVNDAKYSPYFLSTFLLSKYGRLQTDREATGNVQRNLFLYKIRNVVVPQPSKHFQNTIEDLVRKSQNLRSTAIKDLSDAEAILTKELQLYSYEFSPKQLKVSDLSEILEANRFDAEFFQPVYDDIAAKIMSYKNGSKRIGELFTNSYVKPKLYGNQCQYIEIGDISIDNAEYTLNAIDIAKLPSNAKKAVVSGDVLISKVRPNRGAVTILSDDVGTNTIASGAFTVLQESGCVKKEVLMAYLRLPIIRKWLLKWNIGTTYPVIKDENILELPIPILDDSVQNTIVEKVKSSFANRKIANLMCECAKQSITIAIEHSDRKAIMYIEKAKERFKDEN